MTIHMFRALSEPNRLNIVELLYKNPRTVNEIAGVLKLNQPQTSKHLKVLADAGVIAVHPIKNQRVYALQPEPFKELDTWLEKYRKAWQDRFDRLDTILAKEKQTLLRSVTQNSGKVKKGGEKNDRSNT